MYESPLLIVNCLKSKGREKQHSLDETCLKVVSVCDQLDMIELL